MPLRTASTPGPHHQQGAAALLLILTMIVILTIVLAPRLTLWQVHNAAGGRGYQRLIDAKAAILAHAANPGADTVVTVPPRRLGQISLTPDLPVLPGSGYDGLSKTTPAGKPGCATRTWAPGQALTDPASAVPLDVRCFGRFPWLSFGLPGPSTPDDQLGEVPWIFMSANLVVNSNCFTNLNPLMLSSAYTTGGCVTSSVPFPWLRVVDARGNLLSSEVAIVLILPGPPVQNGQTRSAPIDHAPSAYLEGLTVAAGCPAPCVPGTYNNAAYTVASGSNWTFIDAPSSTSLGPPPAYYATPFQFNDHLIYITASEYFEAMEQRARLAVLATLSAFRAVNGYLPYSGDSTPLSSSCTSPYSHLGLLPQGSSPQPLTCGGGVALNYKAWLIAAGWGNYFIYAVDPGCTQGAPAQCLAPSLRLGGAAQRYNAVLFSPGRAIQSVPYASKGAPQTPLGVSHLLNDFLDSAGNLTGPPFDAAGTPLTANYDDRMYGIP
jgi:hypothetical protein